MPSRAKIPKNKIETQESITKLSAFRLSGIIAVWFERHSSSLSRFWATKAHCCPPSDWMTVFVGNFLVLDLV